MSISKAAEAADRDHRLKGISRSNPLNLDNLSIYELVMGMHGCLVGIERIMYDCELGCDELHDFNVLVNRIKRLSGELMSRGNLPNRSGYNKKRFKK